MPAPPTRRLRIIAQDPSILREGRIVTANVEIPNESLAAGPRGYRVQVIDYDPGADLIYPALDPVAYGLLEAPIDPFAKARDAVLLGNPAFHAQNAYAIVMRTLSMFEFALGRRIGWAFDSHQLNVAPHGLIGANAFYSKEDRALVFGYFTDPQSSKPIFSCLSHDVVTHETSHAILDGLRRRFMDPSSPDQAAFHEGYADLIALLSAFAMPEVIRAALEETTQARMIPMENLTAESIRQSILTGLAEQMGYGLSGIRGNPLRRSVTLAPSRTLYTDPRFEEEHKRGELLVAAVMHAFIRVWEKRMNTLGTRMEKGGVVPGSLDAVRVTEEAAAIAGRMMRIMIRAIDYTPPAHLRFGDFLSAALTADHELVPDDSEFGFRAQLLESFAAYGIEPASTACDPAEPGLWMDAPGPGEISYAQTRFESMQRDENEVFRFLWENRIPLKLNLDAFTNVLSVRPCRRLGPDGFILHETVAEYLQILQLGAKDRAAYGISAATWAAATDGEGGDEETVALYGGGTLVFDEYGRLKFHITNRVDDKKRQRERIAHLLDPRRSLSRGFAALHMRRTAESPLSVAGVAKPGRVKKRRLRS